MRTLPEALLEDLSKILETKIHSVEAVSGGDINEARLLNTDRGLFFLKFNPLPGAEAMFVAEARGLALLREAGSSVPEVIKFGTAAGSGYLLLEFVERVPQDKRFWEDFGMALARQHAIPQPYYGLPFDNFIGSLEQPNGQHESFIELFVENRLQNQLESALAKGRLNAADGKQFERLYLKLPSLLPEEAPALIHGDLWSGNFLSGAGGLYVLIDPAVAWAQREMDLAMSQLFGGFSRPFYEAYQAAYPLQPGFSERVEIYQLYYLLVHVNLFGGSYMQSVRNILKRFA